MMRRVPEPWRASLRAVAVPWAASRAGALLVGYLAARVIGFDPLPVEQAAWRVSSNVLANLPARWDAYWYLDIVLHGYRWVPETPYQQNVVFFPAYPVLTRLVGTLLGEAWLLAGMTVSLAAFFLALVYLRRLALHELGEAAAQRAVWLLAAYPFAVFFGAVYTESLFLLALAGAFTHTRLGQWGRASAWGVVLGLTRPNGWFTCLPLLCVVLAGAGPWPAWRDLRQVVGGRVAGVLRERWRGLAAAAAPVVGMLIYSAYLWWTFGRPFEWIAGQSAWGSLFSPRTPPDPKWGAVLPFRPSDLIVHAGNIAAIVFAALGARPVWRRLGAPYGLLIATMLFPPLLAHGIVSMGRFTSVMFPLFFWLAAGPASARTARWVTAFAVGQAIAASLFFSWRLLV
jgi:hypothetical protein